MFGKFRRRYYTSPNQAWTLGGMTKLDFTGWVPVSEDGKRVIIDGFELNFQGSLSNADEVDAFDGRDAARLFRNITVEQKDGVKRYDEIDGGSMRVAQYMMLGPENVRAGYNIGAATEGGPTAATAYTFSMFVPMFKPRTSHPYDFSMPADVLRQVRIAMAQNADLSVAAEITIASGIYWVTAVCHLEPKAKVYAVDSWTVMDFQTQLQTVINCSGRPHDLGMYLPGVGGGLPISNLTDALVVDLYEQSRLSWPDLIVDYSREQGNEPGLTGTTDASAVYTDPFVPVAGDSLTGGTLDTPRASALLLSTGNHPDEGPVRENLTVKTTQTADLGRFRLLMREVIPRTAKITDAQARKFGANSMAPDRDPKDKTVSPKDTAYFPAVLSK